MTQHQDKTSLLPLLSQHFEFRKVTMQENYNLFAKQVKPREVHKSSNALRLPGCPIQSESRTCPDEDHECEQLFFFLIVHAFVPM